MANVYVKLKKEYCERKDAMAKDILGTLVYPGDNRWVIFKESQLPRIQNHRDFALLDIKSQEVIDDENKNYQKEINDIATGNWKRAEKLINQTSDKQKLKDIRKIAMDNDRQIIVRLVNDRFEEIKL